MAVVVPRYQPGQVQQTNLPNARYSADGATPEAFGAGIARGLGALGEVAGKIAVAERERQDTAAVMEAEAKLREQQNEMLFGETGAFRTKGKDAFGLPERVLPEFDKRRGEIASGLRGRQRELFERRTAMWQTDMQGDLLRHVARESDDYAKATTQAYIEASGQTALNYYNDPKRVDAEIARAQDAFMAGSPGMPAEAVRLGLNKIESGIRRGIVDRIATDSPAAAIAYYDKNRDLFTGEDQAAIEKALVPAAKVERGEEIGRTALETGTAVGTDYVAYRRALESGGRADAKNPNSSALGADQFVDSTWLNMVAKTKPAWADGKTRDEILSMRTDPAKSAEMADALDQENAAALQAAGEPPTNENLYAAHHFGAQVGVKFAQADDDTPITGIISDAQLKANPYLRGMTKGEAVANWNSRAGASSPTTSRSSYASARQRILDTVEDRTEREAALTFIDRQEQIDKSREVEIERGMIQTINTKVEQADPTMPLRQVLSPSELAWAQENGRLGAWEQRQKSRLSGEADIDTPPDVLLAYRDVVYRAARGDAVARAELAKYNPYDPKLKIAQSDRDWLAQAQANVASGDKGKIARVATEGEINDVIERYTIQTLGVEKAKIPKDKQAWQFQNAMRSWADDFARKNDRSPSYNEVVQQADLLVLQGSYQAVEDGWFGQSVETRQFRVAELGIPPNALELIQDALQQEGKPINANTIAAKWQAYMRAQAGAGVDGGR